jgi:glutaredoxin-related protein
MKMRVIVSLAGLLVAVMAVTARAAPVVVSRSVGQVGDRVVTSREVQISAAMDRVLFPQKEKNPSGELKLGDPAMRDEVTAVLLEVVVHREAENFSVARVSDEQIAESVRKVERGLDSKAYWQDLEVSATELKRFVTQKLTAKAFIQFKTNSMVGVISDSEALAYYEKNRLKFGEVPFAGFKENIKTYLAQQQLEDRTRAWFEIIKRKYKVRNILAENFNNKVGPR